MIFKRIIRIILTGIMWLLIFSIPINGHPVQKYAFNLLLQNPLSEYVGERISVYYGSLNQQLVRWSYSLEQSPQKQKSQH